METYAGDADRILKPEAISKVSETTVLDLCAPSIPSTSSSDNKHDIDLNASDSGDSEDGNPLVYPEDDGSNDSFA